MSKYAKAMAEAWDKAAKWNSEHPIGTRVMVAIDYREREETTEGEAYALPSCESVVALKGVVHPVPTDRLVVLGGVA